MATSLHTQQRHWLGLSPRCTSKPVVCAQISAQLSFQSIHGPFYRAKFVWAVLAQGWMIAGTCRACLSISDALSWPFVRNKDPRAMQPLARAGELPRSSYFRLHDPLIRGITSTIFAASLRRCIDLPTSTASRGVLGFTAHSHSTYVSSVVRQFRTPLVFPFAIHLRLPPRASPRLASAWACRNVGGSVGRRPR